MRQDSMVIAHERLERALEALHRIQLFEVPIEHYRAALDARMEVAFVVGMLKANIEGVA
jgi:hypothetical protein